MVENFKKKLTAPLLLLLLLPVLAHGNEPIDVLKKNIDQGILILTDPRYKDPGQKDEQYRKLVEVFHNSFDFFEFSRLALAANWRAFTPTQREAFTSALAQFFTKFYMMELQDKYNGEKVTYVRQARMTDIKAQVSTEVLWKDLHLPVQVRMVLREGKWKAYDVVIVGISGMKNYRAQFNGILRSKTPDQVIEMLRGKVKKLEEKERS